MRFLPILLFLFLAGNTYGQVDLPITFDVEGLDYELADFEGNASAIVVDPTDPNNMVGEATKSITAGSSAGTTMGEFGLASEIPLEPGATQMSVRVWSPDAGIPIRLKVEETDDPTKSVETETLTTVAMAWETLTFDFSNEATGTAAINFDYVYDQISIFFNFGTTGAAAGEKIYYWDDVQFGVGVSVVENIPANEANIVVAPNPASSFIQIELPTTITEATELQIFDSKGQLVAQEIIRERFTQIQTDQLANGMYVISIRSATANYFQQIIIAK